MWSACSARSEPHRQSGRTFAGMQDRGACAPDRDRRACRSGEAQPPALRRGEPRERSQGAADARRPADVTQPLHRYDQRWEEHDVRPAAHVVPRRAADEGPRVAHPWLRPRLQRRLRRRCGSGACRHAREVSLALRRGSARALVCHAAATLALGAEVPAAVPVVRAYQIAIVVLERHARRRPLRPSHGR